MRIGYRINQSTFFHYLKWTIYDYVLSKEGSHIPKTFIQGYNWVMQEENIKKVIVPEIYDHFAKMVKADCLCKNISIVSDV